MTPRQPIDEVSGERLLPRRPDRCISLATVWQEGRAKAPLGALGPDDHTETGGLEVARPADVAVRMPDVSIVRSIEQADQSGSGSSAAASANAKLDGDPDAEPAPEGADKWVEPRQDPVLQPKRVAPK